MVKSSRRVVLAALAGNGAIALAKFAAAGISGSTAMLTEAIHSLVDTADQVLLLVGQTRGERPADATHPLGYGMEIYFWSFIVALMVFLVGGVLSVYEGVRHLFNPGPVVSPWISLAVLAVAAVFEGPSALPIGNTGAWCADGPPGCGLSSRHRKILHYSPCYSKIQQP
jgi:cation diffusion facilitator family transporter